MLEFDITITENNIITLIFNITRSTNSLLFVFCKNNIPYLNFFILKILAKRITCVIVITISLIKSSFILNILLYQNPSTTANKSTA